MTLLVRGQQARERRLSVPFGRMSDALSPRLRSYLGKNLKRHYHDEGVLR